MEINIGDKVRFLNDVGGGTVVKILPKSQVMVRDANGFEYPYPARELVVIEKAAPVKEEKKEVKHDIPKIEKKERFVQPDLKEDNTSEILFSFLRDKEENKDGFECFLVNDSNYFVFYHVVLRGDNGYEKLDADVLEPNTKICVGELSRTQINFSKEIIIQFVFFGHPYQVLHEMVERRIKIVPIHFFQEHRFLDNEFFDNKAYIFELLKEKQGLGQSLITQEDFENNIKNKEIILDEEPEEDKSQRYKPRQKAPEIEVDLHINQLVDSVIGLSNAEIIQIQMDTFHKAMTDAIMNKASKLILIHGIGNGTLKAALRQSLDVQYKLHYEDASFREYGFGATMVLLNSHTNK